MTTTATLPGPTSMPNTGVRRRVHGAAGPVGDRLIRPPLTPSRDASRPPAPNAKVLVGGGPVDRYRRRRRPPADRARRPGTPRPNYVARRCAAALLAVAVGAVGAASITGAAASFGGAPASAAEVSPSTESAAPTRHVARPGDTLWSIATTYRGSIAHDRYVDALIRLNGGTAIEVGQAVRLP